MAVKRILDLVIAVAALAVLSPLVALLAVLIVVDSGRPIFYRRRVMGRGGVRFDAWKFRTMAGGSAGAHRAPLEDGPASLEGLSGCLLTVEDDPRVTRVGRWLRRFSLDEIPQLFNVLRGDMSLVGPRMLAPDEHASLSTYAEWQRAVLEVKPGITGLWQVSGRRDLPYHERVRLDLEYVSGATLWTDVVILLRTIPAVVTARGAF